MNIVLNYDPVAAADPGFVADAQAAVAILNRTFTNNITLTFDIGLGSIGTLVAIDAPIIRRPLASPLSASAGPNAFTQLYLPYSELREKLLTFGQPNFFTPTNLPDVNRVDGRADFYVSSRVGKAFGLPARAPHLPDGVIGIGPGFPGTDRIDTIMHEIGHAMGRMTADSIDPQGRPAASELDLMRF